MNSFHFNRLRHLPKEQRDQILSRMQQRQNTKKATRKATRALPHPIYIPSLPPLCPKLLLPTKLYRVRNKDTITDRLLIKLPIPQTAYKPGTTVLKRQNIQTDREDTHTVFYKSSQTSQKGLPPGFYPIRFISSNGYINKDYGLAGIIPLLFKTFPELRLSKQQLECLLFRFAYWWQFKMSCAVSSFGEEFEQIRIVGLHFDYDDGVFVRRVSPHFYTLGEPDQVFFLQKGSTTDLTVLINSDTIEELNEFIQ